IHDNLAFFKHLIQNNLISPDPLEINNSTKALILHAISYKAHHIIHYMMSFPTNFLSSDMNDIALEFLEEYPHHPWAINVFESMIQHDQFFLEALFKLIEQQWLNSCPEKKDGYLRIVELISKYANPQKLNLAKDFAYNSKKIKPLAYYLDQKINYQSYYPPRFDFDIEILIKNGAKLDDKTVDGNETNCLALCESHLPDMLETINRIQFEYAHDSRWQKLLDMGALTKDVDLYIYDLVCQNPQLIVENQTLKTLFCQILSQENRPHIDSIWEAYHDNVVQHPLTHIIQNFLVKRRSKMTQHNALDANIMEDPLSFTTGYCHYLGKDVLLFLDNNLDERKSLLTTKLYQAEIKPYLLPKSINHSLFSQLCQHKNVSDLGQHRFDQRYGLSIKRHNT
ncbi:hypothetical protein EB169_12080, partial [archaeon]|nr:hypothetical protein [archaeon]